MGVPSNLYAFYHAAVQLKQRNELGVYLMNLTVSDLLYLTSLPLWLQYIFQVNNSATFLLDKALPLSLWNLAVVPLYFNHLVESHDPQKPMKVHEATSILNF